MPRERWNDVPGDIAGGHAENLPGGFGTYDPDHSVDATIDELVGNDVRGRTGPGFTPTDQRGGDTTGTGYTDEVDSGSTVEPSHLLEGEEGHPGAMVGFTGAEPDKRVDPESLPSEPEDPRRRKRSA